MKKHILGLAIFSFIVFATAFACGIFSRPEITPTIPTSIELKREIKRSQDDSPNVVQAIYSVKTKMLAWHGTLPNEKNAAHFDFWTADGKNFKYIGSMPVKDFANGKVYASNDLNLSLSKIAPSVNLYLIAEADDHFANRDYGSLLKFDARNAVSVTIDYGE